jgi:flagellar protein FliS
LASLNLEQGGEIAKNLQRLYSYMFNELIDANLNKDAKRVEHVLHLLRELRVGWQGIKGTPDARGAAAPQAPAGGPAKRITVKG